MALASAGLSWASIAIRWPWSLAAANCRLVGQTIAEVQLAMPASKDVAGYASWQHRPGSPHRRKTKPTRVEFHEPDLDALEAVAGPEPQSRLETRSGNQASGQLAGSG